ncbi:MAG: hypothetical protein RLZ14_1143 [Actinomycetota bacterium]
MIASFGVGQVFLSFIFFFLFVMWIMLVFQVFGDIFGNHGMSGVKKVLWMVGIIVFPFLGVFTYLIIHGRSMAEKQAKAAQAQEEAVRSYIRDAAGTSGVDEIARLHELRQSGAIDDAEFAKLKARIVG